VLELVKQLRDLFLAFSADRTIPGEPFQIIKSLGLSALHQIFDCNVGDILAFTDNLGNFLLVRVVSLLLHQIVIEGSTKALVPKDGAVELVICQPSKGLGDLSR